jgi:hypothetical protein
VERIEIQDLFQGETLMHPQKTLRFSSVSVLIALLITFAAAAYGQDRPQLPGSPSYEVSLQVIVGSDDAGARAELPKSLAGVMSQLRSSYSFSSYRIANTYLGRIGNTGTVEYKSVTNIFGEDSSGDTPSFLEWSLGGSRYPDVSGTGNTFLAQPFKFGARIPIRFAGPKDEAGRSPSTTNRSVYQPTECRCMKASRRSSERSRSRRPRARSSSF